MLNQATIMGRICQDLDLKATPAGKMVLTFTVAVERDYSGDNGKATDFIPVVAWEKTAQFIWNYFGKGRMIAISGRIQVRQWTATDGTKRTTTEIIANHAWFTGEKKNDATAAPQVSDTEPSYQQDLPVGFEAIDDDDIPF